MKLAGVYITIPNGSGWLHKSTHFAICKLLADRRYRLRHACPTHCPYVDNLHACMNDFLNGGEDYWLTFDDDNPPLRNPLDLVELDCDVIGLPTPVWHSAVKGDRPFYFNALDYDEEENAYRPHEPTDGLQEVDAVGSGCLLIARRVIERLKTSQPFSRKWKQNGRVEMGCDFSFCEKARNAGFRVFAHFDYLCDHFNELPLMEVIESFRAMNSKEHAE